MTREEYLSKFIVEPLVQELEPILQFKEVTTNTALLGAYTEAALRRLIRRVVHPLQVSTGAVLDYPILEPLIQIDLIIWAPFPVPSIFAVDDFGLVPRSSAFGAIEIKRSNYSQVDEQLEKFANEVPRLIAAPSPSAGDVRSAVMGVVCVLQGAPSSRLEKLFEEDKALAIFEKTPSSVTVRSKDVIRLINFLHYISWRYRRQAAQEVYWQLPTT